MALKLKDIILDDVQALIKNLTGFEKNEENFKACERYILSNLVHHRFLSVDSHAVRRSYDGMVMKFHVHGLSDRGQQLDSLVKEFLASLNFKDHGTADIQWSLLSLLLNLGESPTNFQENEEIVSQLSITEDTNNDSVDWKAYLKEGEEEFYQDWNVCSSDEDEVDCMVSTIERTPDHLNVSTISLKDVLPALSSSLPYQKRNDQSLEKDQLNAKQHKSFVAQNILCAESWLRNNVQQDWWSKAHITHKPVSKHPFSNTAYLCDPSLNEGIQNSTLSEHKVVLEIIWLLSAPCNTAVFMEVISDDGRETHFCVRPHITVPSLTQDVFASFMSSICGYADMIKELQTFCSEVYGSAALKRVCGTYKAYGCALECELKPVFEALSQLEQQAHKQKNTLTLVVLMQDLSSLLSTVSSLHKLHKSAVLDWKQYPYWLCATHLLSVILFFLRSAGNVGITLRIFVVTFQVYIKIIDLWLTEGQLYDAYDEFFISMREQKSVCFRASFEMRDWEKELAALGLVEPPRALQVLANCLLKAAQPLHVLYELKRLPELGKHTSSQCSLVRLFLQTLMCGLEASQLPKPIEKAKEDFPWWEVLDSHLTSEVKSLKNETETQSSVPKIKAVDVEPVMNHLQRLQEPLFMKGFRSLFGHSPGIITPDSGTENTEGHIFQKLVLLSYSMTENLPLESCVEQAVLCLFADWEGIAGALVADILIQEHQLLHHINVAQSVFLLQSAYKLQPFLSYLFKLILRREELNAHTLSVLLQDCVDSDQFTLSVNSGNEDITELNALDIIDSLSIKYQVNWPLCAILRDESQSIYNSIFNLLLKIRWGLWNLEKLNVTDLNKSYDLLLSRRLFHLRYWLLNVMRGTYDFLAGHVVNVLSLKFGEDIKCAKNMLALVQVHNRFLECSLLWSLNAGQPDPIKNALFQLVVLAENLHSLWGGGPSKMSLSKLDNLEVCYAHCHRFLAACLHTLAEEEGLQHLVFLSDLFNLNLPKEM